MSLLRSSSIYLGSSLISKAVPFILLPFLTNSLTKYEFGLLSLFLVVNTFFIALIGMGMHVNVTKYFHSTSNKIMAVINGNLIVVLIVTSSISLIVIFVASKLTDELFSVPVTYLYVLPFLSVFNVINNIFLAVLRNQQKVFLYATYELISAVIVLFGTITLLLNTDLGWRSQIVSMLLAGLVMSILGMYYLINNNLLRIKPIRIIQQKILHISLPLIPHAVGGIIISLSDRIFIERMIGVEEVGIYSIGYSFGALLSLFTDAFVKAWNPWFFKVLSAPDSITKWKVVKYTYQYIVGVFVLGGVLSFLSIIIMPLIIQEEFIGANEYVLWVALGYAFHGIYKIFFPYLVLINRTTYLAFSTTLSALINLLLNYLLILKYGAVGAAYATIAAFALSALLVFIYQYKHYPMPWFIRYAR
jgi:O-antigen/teichoic acid export membrane protein